MVWFPELSLGAPEPGRNDNDSLMIARAYVVATKFDSSFARWKRLCLVRPQVQTPMAVEQSGFHADRVTSFRPNRGV